LARSVEIFDIQRFSWHDGPGIRTVVFFKGCDMRCSWCHNPESQRVGPELMYYPEDCMGCGRCAVACPVGCHSVSEARHVFDRANCAACGACAEACYAGALRMAGRRVTIDALTEEALKDAEFYRVSGGGVTLSGGEPLLQADDCRALLERLRDSGVPLTTALDTAGHVPWSAFEAVLPMTDYVLYDVKAWSDDDHRRTTGVSNRLSLKNLRRLRDVPVRLIIRVPVIPGVNDTVSELEAIMAELHGYRNVEKIELLPYHTIGVPKYRALGRDGVAAAKAPEPELMEQLRAVVERSQDPLPTTILPRLTGSGIS
jgi:glycyl-radical enzyme activating protein